MAPNFATNPEMSVRDGLCMKGRQNSSFCSNQCLSGFSSECRRYPLLFREVQKFSDKILTVEFSQGQLQNTNFTRITGDRNLSPTNWTVEKMSMIERKRSIIHF